MQFFIFWNLKPKGLTIFFTKLQISVKDYLPSCICLYASLLWITPNSDVHTDNLCCQDFEGKNNTLNKKIGGFPENDWNIAFVIFYTLFLYRFLCHYIIESLFFCMVFVLKSILSLWVLLYFLVQFLSLSVYVSGFHPEVSLL